MPNKPSPAAEQLLELSQSQVEILEKLSTDIDTIASILDLATDIAVDLAEAGEPINGETVSGRLKEMLPDLIKEGFINR